MAFKMKRSSVSLRSSSRITPITTKQSPLRQGMTSVAMNDDGTGINVNQEGITETVYPGTSNIIETEVNPDGGQDPNWAKTCEENPCLKPCNDQFGNCPDSEPTVVEGTEGNEGSTSLTMPGDNRTMNVVGQRSLRKNVGTQMSGGRKLNRLKKNANKNIRKNIRKGVAPDPRDIRILSGSQTINMDHYDPAQDVAGNGHRSLFSGENASGFIAANQSGGKDLKYGPQLLAEAERLLAINPDLDRNSQEFANQVNENVSLNVTSQDQAREGGGFDPGQYMDNKTRGLIRRRGVPGGQGKIDALGGEDNFQKTVRPAKAKRDKKRADNKAEREEKRADNKAEREEKREIRKAEKKVRRDKKKEEKDSPAKMTVNVTRPSYKMGGFGSK